MAHDKQVPGPNDSDPDNQRLRPFQGGTDGLTKQPTGKDQVRSSPWANFEAKDVTSLQDGAGQADTGASPALMSEPD